VHNSLILPILITVGQEFRLSKHINHYKYIFSYKKTYSTIPSIHHPWAHTGARLSNILDYQTTCTDHRLGSSVSITTAYRLDGPGSNPGGGEIFHTCPDWL
jgi:hypothetical protein